MIGFILGLFVGATIGLITAALCHAASHDIPAMHDYGMGNKEEP